jgi:hypothetical protein
MSNPMVSYDYGRAWKLVVTTPPNDAGEATATTVSSGAWDPETLRITFEVSLPAFASTWYAKIEIFNLNASTAQQLIYGQGSIVSLEAGYQVSPYGVIFQGVVYQALYERVGVIDSKVTLMCYTGMKETLGNFASFRGDVQSTQAALIAKMVAGASTPLTMATIDTVMLSQTRLPRRRPFFGDPSRFIEAVAAANNMQAWYGFDGINVSTMSRDDSVPTITYTSTTGLLGTPQQTQDGVTFQVTLDNRPRVQNPPMQVNIASAVIRQLPVPVGSQRPLLDANGLYLVNGIQHVGDSRGQDWYTTISGFTSIGGKLAMIVDAADPTKQLDRRSVR